MQVTGLVDSNQHLVVECKLFRFDVVRLKQIFGDAIACCHVVHVGIPVDVQPMITG
jgi:hypothetical protein